MARFVAILRYLVCSAGSLGRSNAIWIVGIALVSVAVAIFSFTQASRGFDRVVALSDARKTARQTLVALLDQEAALRAYLASTDTLTLAAYRRASLLELSAHHTLRASVQALEDGTTKATFRAFEAASRSYTKTIETSVLGRHRIGSSQVALSEMTVARSRLSVLTEEFNTAAKDTVALAKLRILLAGLISVGSTVLFGVAALVMEQLRRRVQLQRAIELNTNLLERERADIAVTRADLLQAGNAALEHEIVERKLVEERLAFAAFHDELTGLANRALLADRLARIVGQNYSSDHHWAILFLDLDRFKVVNDSLGHTAGDQLLVAVARRLERCLRADDTLARLGGDEFTILLDDIEDVSVACLLAERVLREFDSAFSIAGRDVFATVSIGIATSRNSDSRPEEVLRAADIAMYRAKELGKQRYEVFSPELLTRAVALLEVETDLARALQREEFRLYYQPIVALGDGHLTGFEALVRWQHPRRGLVSPDQFISVAEETGAIVAIGEWILREACRQAQAWRTTFDLAEDFRINVNVSTKQLATMAFTSIIDSALADSGLDPRGLNLEITESVLMNNPDEARATLTSLRRRGIRVHLDDFGTGYSSLAYLHGFPIDTVKIDRSFVSNGSGGIASPEIVRTIVTLAQSLSITVTAEGIETGDQLAQLRELGCANGQGYYFSRPVDAHAAGALIAAAITRITELAS